jgi:hypothetical protein
LVELLLQLTSKLLISLLLLKLAIGFGSIHFSFM